MLKVRNNLWLISDTHFGHRNIVKFCQRPASHEIIMLSEWAARVRDDDQILHLGDVWMKSSPWRWAAIISRLPGKKFLIRGNHDNLNDTWYERAGFEIIPPFVVETKSAKNVAFTHIPLTSFTLEVNRAYVPDEILYGGKGWDVNVHGHTHNNPPHPTEGTPDASKRYINVCVENTKLAPVQLGNILPIF